MASGHQSLKEPIWCMATGASPPFARITSSVISPSHFPHPLSVHHVIASLRYGSTTAQKLGLL